MNNYYDETSDVVYYIEYFDVYGNKTYIKKV